MNDSFVFLYHKTLESRVFKNEGLLKVWIWCLLKANYKESWVTLKTGKSSIEVKVMPGQFIFGRNSAAKQLRMNPETVRKRMNKLKNMQNLTINSTNQYSLVTIVNWESYQGKKNKVPAKVPGKYQASTTNNKDNKDNNKEKHIYGEFKNVRLTDEESEKLKAQFGEEGTSFWIEQLSAYVESKGKKYKSHYATILNWDRKDGGNKRITTKSGECTYCGKKSEKITDGLCDNCLWRAR
jgi:hypothetical protein